MNEVQKELTAYLLQEGISDIGFSKPNPKSFGECPYAVTLVAKLSDAIIDEINGSPTHTYFHHYRTINTFLDQCALKTGFFLEKKGYRYITVAASQSININGWNYDGRYSHKEVACQAGLGTIGKNSLFLHYRYGSRVRLATVFTNCPFEYSHENPKSICGTCHLCVDACPSGAILGKDWASDKKREELFDAEKCSRYMKEKFKHIGRGAVCGVCIKVCPRYTKVLHNV